MVRLISVALIAVSLAGWTGGAKADPRLAYTRHALKLDLQDLDLSRSADRRVLAARIAGAADEVCGGRPDRTSRYTADELKLLLPAYEKCRSDAIQRAEASVTTQAQMLAGNDRRGN